MFDNVPIIDLFSGWLPEDIVTVLIAVIVLLLVIAVKRIVV